MTVNFDVGRAGNAVATIPPGTGATSAHEAGREAGSQLKTAFAKAQQADDDGAPDLGEALRAAAGRIKGGEAGTGKVDPDVAPGDIDETQPRPRELRRPGGHGPLAPPSRTLPQSPELEQKAEELQEAWGRMEESIRDVREQLDTPAPIPHDMPHPTAE